ncbi:cobalamin B12-binding domain-containing protein [Ideonella sp. 4Y11]|uniref:Cobalamin B12-binding domain-containing protein n=1 Tax=Ideonella aquatica TaxID=2824119 RepID=A0A940YQG3_9BURK|nr:cobalamin B12-binding domain-containing protein [Ideonella aquatica]MBQ0960113.1 cobalamin B12-binding domain-containing protein [Ideonella aquatica]
MSDARHGIADIERETGLGKDTLRVWERRYGFPSPERDAQGERRYDDGQLHRLRLIRRLLDAGHRPGQVVPLPTEALVALGSQAPAGRRPRARHAQTAQGVSGLDPQWLALVREHRLDALLAGLRQQWLARGLVATLEEVVAPLAAQVGAAWAQGELSVYQEHLFSEAVEAALREATAALSPGTAPPLRPPRVLLTTLAGELHTLGLLMAQAVLALERCDTVMLGPNTPVDEIAAAAARLQVDAVGLGTSSHVLPRTLRADLERLRAALPPAVALWVGGPAQAALGRTPPPGIQWVGRVGGLQALVESWRGT